MKTIIPKSIILFLWCLLVHSAAAHQDTLLKLSEGVLTGLPKEYEPARFDLSRKVLTIGGKELRFPAVLHRLFPDDFIVAPFGDPVVIKGTPYDLKFSASWYHDLSGLPPYLLIRISPKNRDFAFEILIDLDTLKFIRVEANIKGIFPLPIDISNPQYGEQPGAGQPAPQPADKVPPKDQPSTPTSKDGPPSQRGQDPPEAAITNAKANKSP